MNEYSTEFRISNFDDSLTKTLENKSVKAYAQALCKGEANLKSFDPKKPREIFPLNMK